MNSKKALLSVILLLGGVGLSCGEVIRSRKCRLPSARNALCEVHEVAISPCPQAAQRQPCQFKQGDNVSLSFQYTPAFSAATLKTAVYKAQDLIDLRWPDLREDACQNTPCPMEAGRRQTYQYSLNMGAYPEAVHTVRWMLQDGEDYHRSCCFQFNLQIIQ